MKVSKKIFLLISAGLTFFLYQNCTPFEGVDVGSSALGVSNYKALSEQVFVPRCVSCHSGSSPDGATDLTSQSTIIASGKVQAGDALSSALYTVLFDGLTPKHNTLSEGELVGLANWINGGALANELPLVNAGADKTVNLPTSSTVISGSASDVDGVIATYTWTQVNGPNSAVLTNANTKTLTASNLVEGSYTFRLTVIDDLGGSATDNVLVSVVLGSNVLPVVTAGSTRNITLPTNSVSITASASDSDGSIASYAWTQTSGPSSATLAGTSTMTLAASNLVQGTYVFRILVTDNRAGTANASVSVVVAAAAAVPTFTQLNTEIFLPLCSGCHGSSGGYNMGTYTSVKTRVVVNSATTSKLYKRVNDNSMPPGNSLSTIDKNMIKDWINAGALNN
jgi:mono/diheme cytochrome c family protein